MDHDGIENYCCLLVHLIEKIFMKTVTSAHYGRFSSSTYTYNRPLRLQQHHVLLNPPECIIIHQIS